MRNLIRTIRQWRFRYRPLVEVLIYEQSLISNLNYFNKRLKPARIAPVLKSNAYGHGLVSVAKILDKQYPPFIIVDSFFEALILRNEKIKSALLVIGYTSSENIKNSNLSGVAYTVTSLEELENLVLGIDSPQELHLKIDTGMHRQGILMEHIDQVILLVKRNPNLLITGICSHLADADGPDSSMTKEQIRKWNDLVELFKKNIPTVVHFHLSATAGFEYSSGISATSMRLGIGLYGIDPTGRYQKHLMPVLEMYSRITSLRLIPAGEAVGYNLTYKADRQMRLATVPVGYYEGVDRRLSNIGEFAMDGKPLPIRGRVSMNMTSIDVTNQDVELGDQVQVISAEIDQPNSVVNIAKQCKTIPYVILVHIPQHLRRTVVD